MSVGVRAEAGSRPVATLLFGLASVPLLVLAGCGGGGEGTADASPPPDVAVPDAEPPDAIPCDHTVCGSECVDTSSNPDHCGECFRECTPSQECAASDCACPEIVPPTGELGQFLTQMDDEILAPTVLGIGVYTPDDSILHAVVIGFHPTDTPVDTDLDLSVPEAGDPPFVGFGFDLDVNDQTYRGSFRSISGTLHLTTRCADGVAGTMSNVVLHEVDATADPPEPYEDPCTIEIESLSFDYFSGLCP